MKRGKVCAENEFYFRMKPFFFVGANHMMPPQTQIIADGFFFDLVG